MKRRAVASSKIEYISVNDRYQGRRHVNSQNGHLYMFWERFFFKLHTFRVDCTNRISTAYMGANEYQFFRFLMPLFRDVFSNTFDGTIFFKLAFSKYLDIHLQIDAKTSDALRSLTKPERFLGYTARL